ncbi:OprO/OprP family phosphate-selective porin [Planctomycetota bacterium]
MQKRPWLLGTALLLIGPLWFVPLARAQEAEEVGQAESVVAPEAGGGSAGGASTEVLDEPGRESFTALERIQLFREEVQKARDEVGELRRRKKLRLAADEARLTWQWGDSILATWKDGFNLYYLHGEEGSREPLHGLGVHGLLQIDYRHYVDEHNPHESTFGLGALRLSARGFGFEHAEYTLEVDLSEDGNTRLADAFVNLNYWTPLQLKVGHIRTPMLLEQLKSEAHRHFIEDPMIRKVAQIDRDLGGVLHGDCGFATYAVGLVNGRPPNQVDNIVCKDFVARLQLTPFKPFGDEYVETFGLGASVTHGIRNGFAPKFEATSGTEFLPLGRTRQFENVTRAGVEAVVSKGGFTVQAEYIALRVTDLRSPTAGKNDLDVNGWYVDCLYTLTHEPYVVGKRFRPLRNLNPLEGGWGTIQVAGRYEGVSTESGYARTLATGTDRVDAFTVGVNWYWNPNVKFQLNYQKLYYDDHLGLPRIDNGEDLVFARIQLDF